MNVNRPASCRVDRNEALRYLGYSGQAIDDALDGRIDAGIAACERASRPAWCFETLPAREDWPFPHAESVAFMACTLGLGFDREARLLAASSADAVESLAFDAAGSSLVEVCADACERAIAEVAARAGLFAGQRVSPGYGDLPLAFSGDILRALDVGKRLGISLTESNLLVPVKSVTAVVGLFAHEQDAWRARRSCADCIARADCSYLQAGNPCHARA